MECTVYRMQLGQYCIRGCHVVAGEKETRAWTINAGMTAPQAAGVIHTDFEKGFIRAETIGFDDFTNAGGLNPAKEKGAAEVRRQGVCRAGR